MLLNITEVSEESLQGQIARQIRAMIISGELEAGTTLPSIRALARSQKVSVITVQRAYELLDREGLIHARRGKGFFVSELKSSVKKDMAVEKLISQSEPLLKNAIAEGMSKQEILKVVKKTLEQID